MRAALLVLALLVIPGPGTAAPSKPASSKRPAAKANTVSPRPVRSAHSRPPGPSAPADPDFTFLHYSDIHCPAVAQSPETIRASFALGATIMGPLGVPIPAPSFAVVTGDLTEFGGMQGAWETYLSWWKNAPFPVFQVCGNHDAAWDCIRDRIRRLHGDNFYSFDRFGCHFVGFDTTVPQAPYPDVPEEALRWLKEDLARVKPGTPVFAFFHHPMYIGEFASAHSCDRLMEAFAARPPALFLVGHGHSAVRLDMDGNDAVMGGSTFGKKAGWNVVSVVAGVLRVAYLTPGGTWTPLLEKPLRAPSVPRVRLDAPRDGAKASGATLKVEAVPPGPRSATTRAEWSVDGFASGPLEWSGGKWRARVPLKGLIEGLHHVRASFAGADGRNRGASVRFLVEGKKPRARWRTALGGTLRAAPAVSGATLFAVACDGKVYALSCRDGRKLWTWRTAGDAAATPLVVGSTVFVGSGDGSLYALTGDGKLGWKTEVDAPVFTTPALFRDTIIFGANDGSVYSLEAATGIPRWMNADAGYAVAAGPVIAGRTVYYGAWDTYAYAVDAGVGCLEWYCQGWGSSIVDAAKRYYSPAGSRPAFTAGRVLIADRHYDLSVIDPARGVVDATLPEVSAVAASADGNSAYLRKTNGHVVKVNGKLEPAWDAAVPTGWVPAPPLEYDGAVYSSSDDGIVTALDAATGKLLWTYQAAPRARVSAPIAAGNGLVFVAALDGTLTALEAR